MAFVTNVGEKKPDIKILSKTIEEKEALKNFVLDIENTGNCRIPHIPKIDIFNEKGKKIKSIEMTERSICPGCSIRYKQDLSFLKKGKYQMVFILDQKNLDSLFGTQYEFEIK